MKAILAIILMTTLTPALAKTALEEVDVAFYNGFATAEEFPREKAMQRAPEIAAILAHSVVYEAEYNDFLQDFIDQALDEMILTKTGMNFCYFAKAKEDGPQGEVSFDEDLIAWYFGTSPKESAKLAHDCPIVAKKVGFDLRGPRTISKDKPKSFYFVISDRPVDMESWTSDNNQTFFFLDGIEIKKNLYRRIIHELSIGIDGKYTELKLDDLVTWTFATMRAYDMEAKYGLKQAGIPTDCIEQFRFVSDALIPLQHYYGGTGSMDKTGRDSFIEKMKTRPQFCTHMATPSYGGFGTWVSRGPSPRINVGGDGDGY